MNVERMEELAVLIEGLRDRNFNYASWPASLCEECGCIGFHVNKRWNGSTNTVDARLTLGLTEEQANVLFYGKRGWNCNSVTRMRAVTRAEAAQRIRTMIAWQMKQEVIS